MQENIKSLTTMGYSVYSSSLDEIELNNASPKLLNTISPNSYGISTKDAKFRESLKNSDFLVLDGVYFALSSLVLQGQNIRKNQGPDVFSHFMHRMNQSSGKVFFLGASQKTLEKIEERTRLEYPKIKVDSYSPPFKEIFSDEDNRKMIARVNAFKPDILFIGMTCPKQETWAYQFKEKLDTKLICCIGAVFDWFAGNQQNIHPLWWKLRLAWLKRTIDRPEILKRYPNIGIFFMHLFFAIIGIKKYKYGTF